MVWRRLPTYFPNISLQMMKLSPENLQTLQQTGYLREVAFRTTPEVTKLEIKAFLEAVYNVQVDKVHTINYQGQKKMRADKQGKPYYVRLQDWKKAYVIFKHPASYIHKETKQTQPVKITGTPVLLPESPAVTAARMPAAVESDAVDQGKQGDADGAAKPAGAA